MGANLRTRLRALVGELHQQAAIYRRGQEISDSVQALAYTQCARKLAAILAESEPEPYPACSCHAGSVCGEACSRGKHHDGCSWEGWRSMPTNDAKAKLPLPLGHEFVPHTNGPERDCTLYQKCHYIGGPGLCGQPREAHEEKR